jgi:predicted nucleotidyltransferase component of viral defense system
MLTRPQVRRYSTQSGLRDMMIAEKEIVLTFLLQLLSDRGLLHRLAFKGSTCLRKIPPPEPGAIEEAVAGDRLHLI